MVARAQMAWLLPLLLACGRDTSTPEDAFACGGASCPQDTLCVETTYDPSCVDLTDTGSACPDGTTRTLCGGAGLPCCCGEAPAPTYTCQACYGTPSCDCVTCDDGKMCGGTGQDARLFVCASPDVP